MRENIKNLIAKTINSRKYDWLWEKISDTYFGYYVRKIIMWLMDTAEDAAIRDVATAESGSLIQMTHPNQQGCKFNVLLIQIPLPSNRKNKRILPLGLGYIASYLRKAHPEINIGILDAQCHSLSYAQVIQQIKTTSWNVIGISCWSVQTKFAETLIKGIKSINKNTVVVQGGVHPTVVPEEAAKVADYVVLHEGEQTFSELISALMAKTDINLVQGLAYEKNGKYFSTGIRSMISDLDCLPPPAFDLLPIEKYKQPLHVVGGERLPIMGSRGCPYKCSFCTSPILWQKKVRWRKAERVVDEIELIIDQYNVNKFHFWDDNFTLNKKFVKTFCQEIDKRQLKIEWIALDRAEHINQNKELLPEMKKSGCVGVEIGLESANPDTFLYISKDQKINETEQALQNLRANNIFPLYTCMVFNPGETIVGYYLQKEFLDKAQEGYPWHRFFHPFQYPIYIGQFATPYKKTEFDNNIEESSLVLLDDPEDRFHHQINTVPYSLLEDVPIRTIDRLDADLYMIFLNAVKLQFWTTFPGNDSKYYLGEKLYDVWRFIYPFFHKADGSMTVYQLGLRLASELNFSFTKSMRLTAFATYIFGQVGVIRSAIYHTERKMPRKHVRVPLAIKLDLLSTLKRFGISRRNLVPVKKMTKI